MNVSDIRNTLQTMYDKEQFITDKTGCKTIQILGASFIADEPTIFGKVNQEYIDAEINWYKLGSTNIHDIDYDPTPAAWQYTADNNGEINSNYGRLINSPLYFNQYNNAKEELQRNSNSRRATMVYTRPSIWEEYQDNGKNDFICTNAVSFYINSLSSQVDCVVQMRSNDAVYGYKNDYAWHEHVLNKLSNDLGYDSGLIYWQVQNLHIYERHFKYLER
jgi:thymidylate synthase